MSMTSATPSPLTRGNYSHLSRLTGIDRTSITRGLRGLRRLSLEDAAKIASVARVSIDTVWKTIVRNREQMEMSRGEKGES